MMATTMCKEKIEAACYSIVSFLGYSSLKDKRREIIVSFVSGNDVFAILPTGYGKSLVMLVYLAYLINFSILQVLLLSPQPIQYVTILGLRKQEIEV